MKKIVIVAGDKSGDLYGGFLSKKLSKKFPELKIYSFGGENLAQHSKQVVNLTSHAVCGLIEVISSLKKLFAIFDETIENIKKINPDLIILIDFPDFNLRLAKALDNAYPIFYYVSPQVWAWRKKRVETIKKYIKKMVVIFNFEKDFYEKEGMDVLYFGHPLLEIINHENIKSKNIISFLPGSRKNEVKKHLPLMQKTKEIIEKELPGYQFRVIRPQNIEEDFYRSLSLNMDVVRHSYKAIEESKFIIASSGTATVEIAILEVPYIIIYKVNLISWHILRWLVKTKFIGMVNILASRKIVKELIQKDANPKKIAKITLEFLKDEKEYLNLKENLKKVKEQLLPQGATEKFAAFIGEYLGIISPGSS